MMPRSGCLATSRYIEETARSGGAISLVKLQTSRKDFLLVHIGSKASRTPKE